MVQHYEQVTPKVSRTCRCFGISRTQLYIWIWRHRYRQAGLADLRDGPPSPRSHPSQTAPHIEALVLLVRWERPYGSGESHYYHSLGDRQQERARPPAARSHLRLAAPTVEISRAISLTPAPPLAHPVTFSALRRRMVRAPPCPSARPGDLHL